MASRGRGRGKVDPRPGRMANSGGGEIKVPKTVEELRSYLHRLNHSNFEAYGGMYANMVLAYSTESAKLQEVVDLVFDTTVRSRDYAELGARVCEKINEAMAGDSPDSKHPLHGQIQKMLVERFHAEFKQKEQIRKESIEAWLGIFAFLCAVYSRIKINDQPIRVFGKAITLTIQYLLEQSDIVDDEIDCICTCLKVCGKLLEQNHAEMMETILTDFRKRIITQKSSCQVRCAILEIIEYRHMGWTDPNKSLDKFYVDAMADAIAEDELGND